MRIGLFGQFGSGNTGNDGSLEAMLQLLKRNCPDAQLVCICSKPDIVAQTFDLSAHPVSQPDPSNWLLRATNKAMLHFPRRTVGFSCALLLASQLDLIIVPGTGILDDFNENPLGWPFAVLRWSLAARLTGTRMIFVSIGAGPVDHRWSRFFIRQAAMLASFRSYRDQISHDFMKQLGVKPAQDFVSADIAFALPTVPDQNRNSPEQCVGIGVMTYRGWKKMEKDGDAIYRDYVSKVTTLVNRLLASGRQVRLLIGDKGDIEAARDILEQLAPAEANKVAFEPSASLHELMQQIARTDVVIASRYHNIVCALAMGRPTISMAYASKNDALLHDTGLAAFCHRIDSFDPETILSQIDFAFEHRTILTMQVKAGVERYRSRLARQEELLHTTFLDNVRSTADPAIQSLRPN
ncbi:MULTISPECIES: polysaccharide pyruvyl transferase family protein [Brucella]|uniref:Polysaccharide pyruvyl transferase family protein n=1 Tax=Brucella lupini TaxID=255457 RepID=A0A256GTK9_9HYPH|nr:MULTISPECIES: polysaccharide pyruvyl transferase family protein [Brucella/Ochrobactrum group]RNL47931.1 dTDP-4-dehydrorhamnose 3,5-epimerase [Ochrobactrum sp. MH181795]KAB2704614.1 dTDP-4-dehydrorhamnose 3,5-epimerase [Brucella lupini]KAB2724558.1 dTDP-4-dehydrorhamnose 3,5-epimerase [Brucella anthropi]KAB2738910.1 dTDP-4-dehydrorhamnose 3,5-epimerase [Brucella anthropi]KAB2797874.1 dTDP-4-dehydrorhamnose 3,5-epimerase [Brucella anthropi]